MTTKLRSAHKIAEKIIKLNDSIEQDVCRNSECNDTGKVESYSPPGGTGWSLEACPSCKGMGKIARQKRYEEYVLKNAPILAQEYLLFPEGSR